MKEEGRMVKRVMEIARRAVRWATGWAWDKESRAADQWRQHLETLIEYPAIYAALVFQDWRRIGDEKSIYQTELGVELSMGALHAGTAFPALVQFFGKSGHEGAAGELRKAMREHGAYAVFRLEPIAERNEFLAGATGEEHRKDMLRETPCDKQSQI